MKRTCMILVAIALLLAFVPASEAGGSHTNVAVGIGVGVGPGWWGPGPFWGPYWGPYWGYPYPAYTYPAYPAYAYPAPVYAPQEPTVYSQQQQPQSWYYCEASKAYYPYVRECPGGWLPVAPSAPGSSAPK